MKTILSILTTALLTTSAYSQTPLMVVKERVGNPEILKYWEVGETKRVNEVSILRVEGENNYDFITNVFFTPKHDIITLLEENAKAQALLPVEPIVECYTSSAPGGQIALFFSRPAKELAEPSNFSLQVLDEEGALVWSHELEGQQPYYYRWEIWYYYATINLPVTMGEHFIVKVDDAGTRKSYTFNINQPASGKPQQLDLSMKHTNF